MELFQILDGASINQSHASIPPQQPVADMSGEYVLPVPASEVQRELLDSVIMSHYSEIFTVFGPAGLDTESVRVRRAKMVLERMEHNLERLAVHPFLLIKEWEPQNLLSKDMPYTIGAFSGAFEALGYILRFVSQNELNIAVISHAGYTTDLLEAFIQDKGVNIYRYSGVPLRAPKAFKSQQSSVHLMPAVVEDLTDAANVAFDFMIVMDESFDTQSDFAIRLRSQLRDPNVRNPLAPVVRLMQLNSIFHTRASLPGYPARLAAATARRHQVGELPKEVEKLYEQELRPLADWFRNSDRPWPLARPALVKEYTRHEVQQSLMQDQEKRLEVQRKLNAVELGQQDKTAQGRRSKRLKYTSLNPESVTSIDELFLLSYRNLLATNKVLETECSDLKLGATHREQVIDEMTEKMQALALENYKLTKNKTQCEERTTKAKADAKTATERYLDLQKRHLEISDAAQSEEKAKKMLLELETEARTATDSLRKLETRMAKTNETLEYMREQYNQALASQSSLKAELESVCVVRDKYKEAAEGELKRLSESHLEKELEKRTKQVSELMGQVANLKQALEAKAGQAKAQTSGRVRYRS